MPLISSEVSPELQFIPYLTSYLADAFCVHFVGDSVVKQLELNGISLAVIM